MRPIIAANFKMHMTAVETTAYASDLLEALADVDDLDPVEIVVAPPFTALDRAAQAFGDSPVLLAAQNVNAAVEGAFTGEISVAMLREIGCRYGIVGHSERRALFSESDESVSAKAAALLAGDLRPIVCVGESLAQRQAERTREVVEAQLRASLAAIPADRASEIVVAYEPIWAIGTGLSATPELAQEVHRGLREVLESLFGAPGRAIRLQYGGSVKPENAADLLAQPDIDGALVGGASLDPASFASIVRAASSR